MFSLKNLARKGLNGPPVLLRYSVLYNGPLNLSNSINCFNTVGMQII